MAKKKSDKKPSNKISKKDIPLKVNTTFENLLRMAANTPPKKKK
jgi:hypothetical protein